MGAGAQPSALAVSGPLDGQRPNLPPWVVSAASSLGKRLSTNTSMPSLDAQFKRLSEVLPGLERKNVMHVSPGVLPCSVALLCGRVVRHSSNGTYAVMMEREGEHKGVLYIRCLCRQPLGDAHDYEKALAGVLEGTEEDRYPWARLTLEGYKKLEHMGRANGKK